MTILLLAEEVEEYEAELTQLKEEYDDIDKINKATGKRLDEIKKRVKSIAFVEGGVWERVVLPAGPYGAWDRTVSFVDEGLDVGLLEELIGTPLFRKVCCSERIEYSPSLAKINKAVRMGLISQDDVDAAYSEGVPRYALRKMTVKQYNKLKEKHE